MNGIRIAVLAVLFGGVSFTGAIAQQHSEGPLTNAAVVKLVRAGFKEKTVIAIIQSRPNQFQLDPEQLIELKHAGVSENIILTMLSLGPTGVESDDWDDDAFFNKRRDPSAGATGSGAQENSIDLFGSGGNSSSESRGRGRSQGNNTDTFTTGSATVRIL